MIGIVVAAHGRLAQALIETAHQVLDTETKVVPVEIRADDTSASYDTRLRETLDEVMSDDGVLVLTDMFGGTPSNVGMTVHQPGRVEVLTGVNLPMLIKALQLSGSGAAFRDIASDVRKAGTRSIVMATEILGGGDA